MSLTAPTWISAVATVLLAIGAGFTVYFARKAFRAQSDQLDDERKINAEQARVLGLQVQELCESLDERKRDEAERRRAQASRIIVSDQRYDHDPAVSQAQRASGVISHEVVTAHVENTSEHPIYDLTITWHKGNAPWGDPEHRPALMPGKREDFARSLPPELPGSVNRSLFGAVVYFRDAGGVHWRARPGGQLDEISPGQQPLHDTR